MIIFGDFKKHTFKYHFLSVANPVENYEVKNIGIVCEEMKDHLPKLNQFLKKYTIDLKQPPPQLVVLRNFEMSSIK